MELVYEQSDRNAKVVVKPPEGGLDPGGSGGAGAQKAEERQR